MPQLTYNIKLCTANILWYGMLYEHRMQTVKHCDILYMSGFCCVCHVFLPLVSIFGLFPVLVRCDYQLICVQLCLSRYL